MREKKVCLLARKIASESKFNAVDIDRMENIMQFVLSEKKLLIIGENKDANKVNSIEPTTDKVITKKKEDLMNSFLIFLSCKKRTIELSSPNKLPIAIIVVVGMMAVATPILLAENS